MVIKNEGQGNTAENVRVGGLGGLFLLDEGRELC